ncbi:MAG: tripartite tricarboxylate transporter substrate binding protein [Betaproteobacteria bacterium]|nr:tripartite tricarboxylate transporter substrate binding protein [Betaproteobacteria bacterium]
MRTAPTVTAALLVLAALALVSGVAAAQAYPSRPIRMIVPWPPGGGTDGTGRILAQALTEELGTQVIVDNRGGASGRIGTELGARAAPDGYTLVMGTVAPNAILPASGAKLAYDTVRDFAPIGLVATSDYVLVVHPSLPVKSVTDLIALAKSRPGQVNFASAGNGSMAQLAAELFKLLARVDMVHVPYKGGGPAVTATVAGEVSVYFGSGPGVVPFTSTGRLRALATSGKKRSKTFPGLPTVAETLPGHEAVQWFALLAPAGTPKNVISKLHAATAKVVGTPKVAQQLAAVGSDPDVSTPEELARHIQAELAKWRKVVKASKLSFD